MRIRPILLSFPLAIAFAGCDGDKLPTTNSTTDADQRPLLESDSPSPQDSAIAQAIGRDAQALLSASSSEQVEIRQGDFALVRVTSASTARCEQVAVTGVLSGLLFPEIGGCGGGESDNVGSQTTIGPAATDGVLRFILPLAAGGTGESMVQGTYPNFVVRLDDGLFDADFDDVVLSVQLFQQQVCPSAPFLEEQSILDDLQVLFQLSRPDDPPANRRERAAFIVEQNGSFELDILVTSADPCQILGTEVYDPPSGTVAWVHTHALEPGLVIPPGVCENVIGGSVIGRGPSTGDVETHEALERRLGRELEGIIIAQEGVYQFDTSDPAGRLFAQCTIGK